MFTWFRALSKPASFLVCTTVFLAVSGCASKEFTTTTKSNSLTQIHHGLKAPAGTKTVTQDIDGLLVGHRLMASGEYELALKAYTRAANEHGLNADVLTALGSANLKLGRLKHAKELLHLAVEKDPAFVPAWNNLGVVLQTQGDFAEASRVFRLAYGLDNGNSEEIRKNLTKVNAIIDKTGYASGQEQQKFELVRRGNGKYLLLNTPSTG